MGDIHAVDLPGRVLLPDGGEHACRIRFDETERVEILVGIPVQTDMRLLCQVDGLGMVDTVVAGRTPAGWRLDVRAGPAHRARLFARMAWHRRRAAGEHDQRGHGRIVPLETVVSVRSASGEATEVTLIDLSASGAALLMTDRPAVGARVVVGRRHATVARHRDDGVAVRFVLPLRPQDVTPDVIL